MIRNVASQKLTVFAFDTTTGAAKTGDAANLTAYVSKDDGVLTALTDTSATELDATNGKGLYTFDLTQGETDAVKLVFSAKSSTSNISVVPQTIYTAPANFTVASFDSNGRVDVIKVAGTTQTARDIGASVLLSSGTGTGQLSLSSGAVLLQATQTGVTIPTVTTLTNAPSDSSGVTSLLSRLTATRAGYLDNLSAGAVALASTFSGITSLAQWLGLIAGKQTGNTTARTELRATGAGSGTYDETTDSQEATRDNMGTAQTGDTYARLGAPAGASVSADVAAVKAVLPAALVSGRIDASVGAMATGVVTATAIAADAIGASELAADAVAEIADAVWDEVLSGHLTSGTTGAGLNAAGSAGDPWATTVPGAYGAGTAGKILGDNLNATVSSRASQTSVDTVDDFLDTEIAAIKAKTDNLPTDPADASDIAASFATITSTLATIAAYIDTEVAAIKAKTDALPSDPADASDVAASFASVASTLSTIAGYLDTEVAAIKAKTDNLPAAPAATGDIPTAVQNADALLGRTISGGANGGRMVKDALRFNRNKFTIAGGTLTVYEEDDTTVAWTATVTQTAGDPVSASDPS